MDYDKRYFRANHNEHTINLIDISMVNVNLWPDGRWKASGWHFVWHLADFADTPDQALRNLIDTVAAWVKENDTQKPVPTD